VQEANGQKVEGGGKKKKEVKQTNNETGNSRDADSRFFFNGTTKNKSHEKTQK